MPIISLKTGSKSRSLLVGNPAYVPGDFISIASTNGTGSSTTVTFSSIPSTYKHLQIRWIAKDTAGTTVANLRITCNGITGTSYAYHQLYGDGTNVTATGTASAAFSNAGIIRSNATVNVMSAGIIDIHDYASTSKFKTFKCFSGSDANTVTTADRVYLVSGLLQSTDAISSINLITTGTAFTTTSTFALYGIKG